MKKKISSVLKQVLEKVEPSKEDLIVINNSLKDFEKRFEKKIKTLKINAEIFVGGSFAKNTMIKKDYYDLDVFIRFDKKHEEKELPNLTEKILKGFKNSIKIHGSRDYFRIKINPYFFIELIPVRKIKNLKEAKNITDLSYSHVNYIKRKIKYSKILDEIRIAKAFCYANKCYGAESYIKGFSGYALELLVYYYGSFLKFVKEISKINVKKLKNDQYFDDKNKIIIDIEKHYKNRRAVLMDINNAKLNSPIILVDPTYKQRNALAALSEETLIKFKKDCQKFLRNPSVKSFEIKKTDLKKIKEDANKKRYEFILFETKTKKQEGDIAGSKLLKFYNHLNFEIEKYFEIKKKGFNYNNKKSAKFFFVVKNKKEIIRSGPYLKDVKNVNKFKKQNKKTFIKKNRIYAREKIDFTLKDFVNKWKVKNKKKIREMDIKELTIIR